MATEASDMWLVSKVPDSARLSELGLYMWLCLLLSVAVVTVLQGVFSYWRSSIRLRGKISSPCYIESRLLADPHVQDCLVPA